MSLALTIDRVLRASPERLYEVWTNPEHLSQWFGVKVEAEPRVGGTIRFHFGEAGGPVVGKFLALEPHRHVAFTWTNYGTGCGPNAQAGAPQGVEPETTVHVTFEREGAGSRLTLRHEGFENQQAFDSHDEGWFVYLELWAARMNAGPADGKKASISETFAPSQDVLGALAGWLGKSPSELQFSGPIDGTSLVTEGQVAARLTPCRFGTCLSLAEWGFATEDERLASRRKWMERFASLRANA